MLPSSSAHQLLLQLGHARRMPLSALILDALFPDSCLSCLAPRDATFRHEVACDACLRGLALPSHFSCVRCAAPASRACPSCHPDEPLRLALAPPESRVVGTLVSALLFDGIQRAAAPLGELLAAGAAAASLPLHRAYVAPVPTPAAILRERGYDANLLLAKSFAELLDLELVPSLLSAERRGGLSLYGIGTPGDAASANVVALVSAETLARSVTTHCNALVRSACPHANAVFFACTS